MTDTSAEEFMSGSDIQDIAVELDGNSFAILNERMNQILSVSDMGANSSLKSVFDSPSEVATAWEKLGLHETTERERKNLSLIAFSDSRQLY